MNDEDTVMDDFSAIPASAKGKGKAVEQFAYDNDNLPWYADALSLLWGTHRSIS